MDMKDLRIGDTVLNTDGSPLLYERRVGTTLPAEPGDYLKTSYTYVFRDLQTWQVVTAHEGFTEDVLWAKRCTVLERTHLPASSGSVDSYGGETNATDGDEPIMSQNLTSDNTDTTTTPAAEEPKAKKTRTVDYTRTDKRPHSFRYKRHSTFVARSGAVNLSKDADGAFVIGPAPEGSVADAGQLIAGQLELVSVKKRPNGKTAIAFSHPELGTVVAYDARAARAALRAG